MNENIINGIDVTAHLGLIRLAVRTSRKPPGGALDDADLFNAGFFGLRRAAEKFDPSRGFRFSTYAMHWIRHHVRRAVSDQGRTIRLPVWYQERARRLGHRLPPATLSLDAPLRGNEAEGQCWLERLESGDDPNASLNSSERQKILVQALAQLPERLRDIIVARFWGNETLAEIGQRHRLSRERIRQLEEEALDLLRQVLSEEDAP
jgi:RNA polymerase sigma factor (sigma-70 family)